MQNRQFSAIINILFTVALVFFANVSFAKGLNADELKALISDKTVEAKSPRGFASTTYYSPDGTFRRIEREQPIKGVWHIDSDGKICRKPEGESTASCRSIVKKGDVWKVYKIPGKVTKPWKHKGTWLKILDGNANNL